ncbi:selenocysteine-specific translation elongation factor [Cellulosimicrobium funkei]|nr:selenocysteine-specific translation elongation factor [Cellulosimicrobium funkei]
MYVVATAGHVDHGKSTLVRALTGMEPDRWAEERRRGLTIDLGFAWTPLPSGEDVAFVDVPGHERFLGNMLAGLGPAPAVCFIVAADEGWQAQSADHRDAIAALGIEHGLLVITKADRAPERADAVLAQARAELAGTALAGVPAVVVSAVTGAGLEELRHQLGVMLAGLPAPEVAGRVRFWVDRSFTVKGSGAVVTGTLTAGTLAENDRLEVLGADSPRAVSVRALHSRNRPHPSIGPTQRVAVNLRGITADEVHRGDALVTPGSWPLTGVVDIRRTTGADLDQAPGQLLVNVGSATEPAHVRPFNAGHARLTFGRDVPLVPGDRLVLRDPGSRAVFGGALVLDVDPPDLTRRGDGTRHAAYLDTVPDGGDARLEVVRRGAVRAGFLQRLGLVGPEARPPGGGAAPGSIAVPEDIREFGEWWVHAPAMARWIARLRDAVEKQAVRDPLAAGMSRGAAAAVLEVDGDDALVNALVAEAGLEQRGGYVCLPGQGMGLGPAEQSIAALERRLAIHPFDAPEGDDLAALSLGAKELAAAERAGRILRLDGSVVLLPTAPARAMRELAGLDQPFTTSQARQALKTSRRVAIPLLEHLDSRGWTRRVDGLYREVVR